MMGLGQIERALAEGDPRAMIKFELDDLNLDGVKKLAKYLGINIANISEETLRSQIAEKKAADVEITLFQGDRVLSAEPATASSSKLALVAAVVAVFAMLGGWVSSWAAVKNLERTLATEAERQRGEQIQDWQQIVVFSAIEKATSAKPPGLNVAEIKTAYLEEATIVEGIDLKKQDLQEMALRRIVIDLLRSGLVYRLTDGRFVVQEALFNDEFERPYTIQKAKRAILMFLSTHEGQFTSEGLRRELSNRVKLTEEEWTETIADLLLTKTVRVDSANKLHSVLRPPSKKAEK
jgi:hypothetical protein